MYQDVKKEQKLKISKYHMYMYFCINIYLEFSSSSISRNKVAWPSGLRRWFKAPVSSEAWVRIPPLPTIFVVVKTSGNCGKNF